MSVTEILQCTVLVVGDDRLLRVIIDDYLTGEGYDVLRALDANEALTLCLQRAELIHLVVTDILMPDFNGYNLADQIRTARPDIRVLFMSSIRESAHARKAVHYQAVRLRAARRVREARA